MPTDTDSSPTEAGSIEDIFQQDDKIDALTPYEVKDAWVRGEFLYEIMSINEDAGNRQFVGSDNCKKIRELLADGSPASIQEAALRGLGSDHPVTDALGWEDGPGNVETLFDKLTAGEVADEELLVEWARDKLKEAMQNSIWYVDVMRDRVEHHHETESENAA